MKNNLIVPAILAAVVMGLFLFVGILVDSGIEGEFSKEELHEFEEKIATKIVDGDTIIVEGGEKVRLLGIDCDERGKECYSLAKEAIEKKILGKTLLLESDVEDEDIYGRKLRHIFLGDKNVVVEMIEEGYCVARFEGDSKYKEEITEAEKFAIENKVGCKWS